MKLLAIMGLSLCLLPATVPRAARCQDADWVELSPAGESFHVSMPIQPRVEKETLGVVSGNRYVASTGIASYTIWSLTNANYRSREDTDAYLDAMAELVWEGLLKSAREQLSDKERLRARMTYVRGLPPDGLPGREYTLTVGDMTGTTQFFVEQEHIFVMLAIGRVGVDWPREKFFTSFGTASTPTVSAPPKASDDSGGGVGPGIKPSTSEVDYNRIFRSSEVTQKARVLKKAEPSYTESARKFGVQGTVIIRCVFSKNGQVTNISIIRRLPHGLTENALGAARSIKFVPAQKDEHPVSMWMQLEYNFNLF